MEKWEKAYKRLLDNSDSEIHSFWLGQQDGFQAGYEQGTEDKRYELESGHKGACHACEPVGELNKELESALREYQAKWKSR